MRGQLLYFLCFLLPMVFVGQEKSSFKLDWEPMVSQETVHGLSISYISFGGASNHMSYGALPCFTLDIDNPSNLYHYDFRLTPISEDTLSAEKASKLTDIDFITDEYQFIVEEGNQFSTYILLPLRFIEDEGIILLLKDFSLEAIPNPLGEPNQQHYQTRDITTESVLNTGDWYKLGVTKSGVYKLGFADLQEMGINPGQLDVNRIGIFGNYTGMLPEANKADRVDDLKENAIKIIGEEDGRFDETDYLLFYGHEATTWRYNPFTGRFDHFNNLYTDTVYYFLTTNAGTGKRIPLEDGASASPSVELTTYSDYVTHELDLVNLIASGKEWYGELFYGDTVERTISFNIPHIAEGSPVILDMEMVARAFTVSHLEVYYNDEKIIDSATITNISSNSSLYARKIQESELLTNSSEDIDIRMRFLVGDETAKAWLNYISLNVERALYYEGGQFEFRNPHVVELGNVVRYKLAHVQEGISLWDISDHHNPLQLNYNLIGDELRFTVEMDSLRSFVVFDESDFYKPVSFEAIENQNLHGISAADFVIIAPEIFTEQAQRLAQLHEEHDGLEVVIVQPSQIYNEFSSGAQDISAIRDFMRMLYLRNAFDGKSPYLLLFGDASYDYKHRLHDNTNLVPTFETIESLRYTQSYVSDDFFGLLDEEEGFNATGTLDVGIGRFPISTVEEAKTAVDKIAHYMTSAAAVCGPWKNTICFVADDEDHNLHLHQAEQLVSIVDTLHDGFNINKIYSDAYPKIEVPGGFSYPESNRLIKDQVNNGALILNYTGHGGLIGWSAEVILDVATIRAFDNINNTPLFITATCEFSRYDDPEFRSAGELVFLNPNGAGVGLLTTTRLAYAHANIILNTRIYQYLLQREDGMPSRLGDLIRLSKTPANANFLNFTLLGDPALRLAHPSQEIETLKVSKSKSDLPADTIKALSLVKVEAQVVNEVGQLLEGFNGYAYPTVYDKPSRYTTLANSSGSYPEDFYLSDKVIFSGKATVVNGLFDFSFMVPKDIAYQYGNGKISYYAIDTLAYSDAWGGHTELFIGGTDENAAIDTDGPVISIFMNDEEFLKSGTVATTAPVIRVKIADEQGIHATGSSLGRDIVLVVDNDYANSMIMNDFFELDVDSYQSGSLTYQPYGLSEGWHSLYIKAWDLQNNSSEKTIDFYIEPTTEVLVSDIKNYPNPFMDETYFSIQHNDASSYVERIEIKIFDIQGRNVVNLLKNIESTSPVLDPIRWDGKDNNGNDLQSGVFVYDVFITDNKGITVVRHQKLIKMKE